MERGEAKAAIVAGAGTGKTTRIIELMVEALANRKIQPTRLLALTFTVKAANEMRDRLAGKLEKLEKPELLAKIDRMEIGTIHSFASHILRQFPVEAGVSPGFREDEGAAAESLFRELWPLWLRDHVPAFLDRVEPDQLRDFARRLCEEGSPRSVGTADEWDETLEEAEKDARDLIAKYESSEQADNVRRMNELRFMITIFGGGGDRRHADQLSGSRPKPLKKKNWPGWTDAEWERFVGMRALAKAALDTDDELLQGILDFLEPFEGKFRTELARRGFVTLHGLLVKAADLLRGRPEIRTHFKERFQLILVDEFQDTDPLQGEILLYLAEKWGNAARRWQDVEVEPGKLVIVGDPKQSIYLFRGADLDAYDAISRKLTGGREGNVEKLKINYRSREELVAFVNDACSGVMAVPEYEAIRPSEERGGGAKIEAIVFPDRKANDAREAEAGAIADWILREGLRWGDVAILLRSLKNSDYYTAALRRKRIGFAIEGEKTFWQVPEVIDFVNLLTAISHPTHEPAVVGILRSPLGAVPDRGLLHLRKADALCPLDPDRVPDTLVPVRRLYETIAELHRLSRRERAGDLVRRALDRLPLREAWAASYRGEQAVANLEKLAAELAAVDAPLDVAISEARRRSRELEEEGESPLADENLDAVRIMSVHKAKGLEFPVVVLADLHRERVRLGEGPVLQEWLTGKTGLRVGSVQNRQRYFVERDRLRRRGEEEGRLLYVALTRAKDRLLLTGGKPSDANFLQHLLGVPGLEVIDPPEGQEAAPAPEGVEEPDPREEQRLWVEREAEARSTEGEQPIRRPSLSDEDVALDGRWERGEEEGAGRELGTVCHDILATIDLAHPPEVKGDAGKLLNPFFRSDVFREIASADEVHREIPFVVALDGQIWSGQIDVLWRRNGKWIVADYKSDREEHPAKYRLQKKVYIQAVQKALGLKAPPEFRLIYLRTCRSVPIPGE